MRMVHNELKDESQKSNKDICNCPTNVNTDHVFAWMCVQKDKMETNLNLNLHFCHLRKIIFLGKIIPIFYCFCRKYSNKTKF